MKEFRDTYSEMDDYEDDLDNFIQSEIDDDLEDEEELTAGEEADSALLDIDFSKATGDFKADLKHYTRESKLKQMQALRDAANKGKKPVLDSKEKPKPKRRALTKEEYLEAKRRHEIYKLQQKQKADKAEEERVKEETEVAEVKKAEAELELEKTQLEAVKVEATPTPKPKKKRFSLKPRRDIPVKKKATIIGREETDGVEKNVKRIIVPRSRKVIIEGMDDLILSDKDDDCDGVKNIGYYKCKKLKELVLTIHNDSYSDFEIELFNPSMPLDFLHSTSLNLNNKVQVAGGIVSYSDVLYNILANPTHIVNAKFTFAGANYLSQINQPLAFENKSIEGKQTINPLQLQLQVDTMQVAQDIVFFDILKNLNRPFIPNGMDIIKYKVLAGNTVTFAFFYEQHNLSKFFFDEARNSKRLL